MKKCSKVLISCLLVALVICSTVVTAFAGGSGYISTPESTTDSFTASGAYKCYSAAETATISKSYTYFKNYSSLSSKFASNNGRTVTIQLWEDDVVGDDHLKTYNGTFSGRTLTEINFLKTNYSGTNIEASGDNGAELYIKYKVASANGDKTTSVAKGLFQFSVGMN